MELQIASNSVACVEMTKLRIEQTGVMEKTGNAFGRVLQTLSLSDLMCLRIGLSTGSGNAMRLAQTERVIEGWVTHLDQQSSILPEALRSCTRAVQKYSKTVRRVQQLLKEHSITSLLSLVTYLIARLECYQIKKALRVCQSYKERLDARWRDAVREISWAQQVVVDTDLGCEPFMVNNMPLASLLKVIQDRFNMKNTSMYSQGEISTGNPSGCSQEEISTGNPSGYSQEEISTGNPSGYSQEEISTRGPLECLHKCIGIWNAFVCLATGKFDVYQQTLMMFESVFHQVCINIGYLFGV